MSRYEDYLENTFSEVFADVEDHLESVVEEEGDTRYINYDDLEDIVLKAIGRYVYEREVPTGLVIEGIVKKLVVEKGISVIQDEEEKETEQKNISKDNQEYPPFNPTTGTGYLQFEGEYYTAKELYSPISQKHDAYLLSVIRNPLASPEEKEKAKNDLADKYFAFGVKSLHKMFSRLGANVDQYQDAVNMSLALSILNYNPERDNFEVIESDGTKIKKKASFGSFLYAQIHYQTLGYLAKDKSIFTVPRPKMQATTNLIRFEGDFAMRHGRLPSDEEISESMGLTLSQVQEAKRIRETFTETSIDEDNVNGKDGSTMKRSEVIAAPDTSKEYVSSFDFEDVMEDFATADDRDRYLVGAAQRMVNRLDREDQRSFLAVYGKLKGQELLVDPLTKQPFVFDKVKEDKINMAKVRADANRVRKQLFEKEMNADAEQRREDKFNSIILHDFTGIFDSIEKMRVSRYSPKTHLVDGNIPEEVHIEKGEVFDLEGALFNEEFYLVVGDLDPWQRETLENYLTENFGEGGMSLPDLEENLTKYKHEIFADAFGAPEPDFSKGLKQGLFFRNAYKCVEGKDQDDLEL